MLFTSFPEAFAALPLASQVTALPNKGGDDDGDDNLPRVIDRQACHGSMVANMVYVVEWDAGKRFNKFSRCPPCGTGYSACNTPHQPAHATVRLRVAFNATHFSAIVKFFLFAIYLRAITAIEQQTRGVSPFAWTGGCTPLPFPLTQVDLTRRIPHSLTARVASHISPGLPEVFLAPLCTSLGYGSPEPALGNPGRAPRLVVLEATERALRDLKVQLHLPARDEETAASFRPPGRTRTTLTGRRSPPRWDISEALPRPQTPRINTAFPAIDYDKVVYIVGTGASKSVAFAQPAYLQSTKALQATTYKRLASFVASVRIWDSSATETPISSNRILVRREDG
ncbi:hypothetical protein DL770_006239 [Monosporascus sp. CRB-9-2]|nr:hypothetical protein DL770_006239 [Monosporascus sp. CRB-9-2]